MISPLFAIEAQNAEEIMWNEMEGIKEQIKGEILDEEMKWRR